MPFIVQCPHPDCRKFMLLEDSDRGGTVACLLCQKPIKVESWSSGEGPASFAAGRAPPSVSSRPAPSGAAMKVQECPHCKAPLRVPAGKVSSVKCPKCAHVFKL